MLRIGPSAHFFHFAADALSRGVASIWIARCPINFMKLSEICLFPKSIFDHIEVCAELVSCNLYATFYPLGNVLHEVFCRG